MPPVKPPKLEEPKKKLPKRLQRKLSKARRSAGLIKQIKKSSTKKKTVDRTFLDKFDKFKPNSIKESPVYVLGMDPGAPNFAYHILRVVDHYDYETVAEGILKTPALLKDKINQKGFLAIREELMEVCDSVETIHLVGIERYTRRGRMVPGQFELINLLIGGIVTSIQSVPVEMITAQVWKKYMHTVNIYPHIFSGPLVPVRKETDSRYWFPDSKNAHTSDAGAIALYTYLQAVFKDVLKDPFSLSIVKGEYSFK